MQFGGKQVPLGQPSSSKQHFAHSVVVAHGWQSSPLGCRESAWTVPNPSAPSMTSANPILTSLRVWTMVASYGAGHERNLTKPVGQCQLLWERNLDACGRELVAEARMSVR